MTKLYGAGGGGGAGGDGMDATHDDSEGKGPSIEEVNLGTSDCRSAYRTRAHPRPAPRQMLNHVFSQYGTVTYCRVPPGERVSGCACV